MSAQGLAHKLVCNKRLLNECAKESNAIIDDRVDMFNSTQSRTAYVLP